MLFTSLQCIVDYVFSEGGRMNKIIIFMLKYFVAFTLASLVSYIVDDILKFSDNEGILLILIILTWILMLKKNK